MTANASPTFYAQQFKTSLRMALQQKPSKLLGCVTIGETVMGAKQAVVVDRIGAVEAQTVAGALQTKNYLNPSTERLWVDPISKDVPLIMDHFEQLKMLSDPSSKFVETSVAAINRAKDDEIIRAFFAATKSGETGASTSAFDTANQQIAVNYDATGNTGLTVAKLKRARQFFLRDEVDLDSEELYVAITDDQDKNLLDEAQYISLDFSDAPVLDAEGKLKRFLKFNFVHTQRLGVDASGYRRVPVWAKSGVEYRPWEELYTNVYRDTNYRGEPWAAYSMATFGAARTDNKLVKEILCAE